MTRVMPEIFQAMWFLKLAEGLWMKIFTVISIAV